MDAHIQPPDAPETPGELGRLSDHLHSLASAQAFTYLARTMRSIDISFSQIFALFHLYRFGPQRIADLARSAYLSDPAASRLASRLVSLGLARKQINPESQRERLVEITPEGLDFIRGLNICTAQAYEELFRPLPPELASDLLDALRRVSRFLPSLPPI
jgi:DNA-binding MarR family transcriptional regulator